MTSARTTRFQIPIADIRAEVDRIVAKHGLTFAREDVSDSPSPFAARYVVRKPGEDGPVIAVAFRAADEQGAIVEVWKTFVDWGIA